MIGFKDLGDLSRLAAGAKELQKSQEDYQKKILSYLEAILRELKEIKDKIGK